VIVRARDAEQPAKALHNGKTQAKAATSFPCRIIELVVLLEDRVKFLIGNADPGVPNLDAELSLAPTTTE